MRKIIDDKGRLFGKLNIIDFGVLLFLLSLTPMFYFGWRIYNRPKPEPQVIAPEPQVGISKQDYERLKALHSQYEIITIPQAEYDNLREYEEVFREEYEVKKIEQEAKRRR